MTTAASNAREQAATLAAASSNPHASGPADPGNQLPTDAPEIAPFTPYDPASHAPGKRMVSVLILTKDEECNIAQCMDTLAWSDDIVVLDSYSTDRTVEIAMRYPNVRVIRRKFDSWSKHSNWALEHIPFKHPWVYYSDADERMPPDLRDEIIAKTNASGDNNAFRLKYKNMFMSRWLRRGGIYPVWIIRLFRPDKIRYEDREVNAHPVVTGRLGSLNSDFIHYSFNKGLIPWFAKHNSYSTMESKEAVRIRAGSVWSRVRLLTSKEPGIARRAAKDISFFPPFRAFIRFFYMYFLRMAFLDGSAGFHYAAMISMYEYWIEVKIREIENSWKGTTEAEVRRLLGARGNDKPVEIPAPKTDTPLIEVMIPTYNEASHIAETVRNALQLGPVLILDSFSTDGTQQIARDAGATVIEHKFENYSKQKNWGIDNLPFKGKWVLILDADERLTPELIAEARRVGADPAASDGYYVNRVVIMMGRQIRHGGAFPSWNLRFFKRGTCRYEDRSVHEHMMCEGSTGYLKYLMLHIRRESLSEYLTKHIKYADMESDEWFKIATGSDKSARAGRLFRDLLKYRLILRRDIWPRVPIKPTVRFVYMYFFKLGMLDGRAGFHLALLMASYEYMIKLLYIDKIERHKARQAGGMK